MNLRSVVAKSRVVFGCALTLTFTMAAAAAVQGSSRHPAIVKKLDETRLIRLAGDVRREANSQNDRGAVGNSMQLQHIQLLLQRPADSEAALATFMDRLQISRHKKLTIGINRIVGGHGAPWRAFCGHGDDGRPLRMRFEVIERCDAGYHR